MSEPSVAASVSARVIDLAAEMGADRRALLAASGIAAASLEDPDSRIALGAHIALLRAAKAMCRDPALALHYGERVNLAEVSVVGLIGYASETMLDAFVQLQRYSRLVMDLDLGPAPRFTLERDADGLWIVDHRPDPNAAPELTETVFAQMVSGTREFGDTPFVLDVHLTHADPGYGDEYERILGAPVRFGRERNAMRIDEDWIAHPIAREPRYAFGILTRHADAELAKLDANATMRGRVEGAILPVLHKSEVGIEAIAARLGCGRDTLYRRLKAEGTNFETVLDELRRRLALDYLGAGKVSVKEAAYLVGFSDPAAFSRAVKRWTGRSPSELRGGSAAERSSASRRRPGGSAPE